MNARQLKARQLVATGRITRGNGYFLVPSQTGDNRHRVALDGLFPTCSCDGFELSGLPCKHIEAVKMWLENGEQKNEFDGINPGVPIPRKTYPRDWEKYNLSQTTEKNWFGALLADLCADIPDQPRKPGCGRKPIPMRDSIFAAVYKVFSGVSARRFSCDLEDARERGQITRPLHFNSVLNVFDNEAVTPILTDLIHRSALPLRGIETEWAVDSTGFSGCKFFRWFDEKYGSNRWESEWVKAHVLCGTTTNVISAVEVLDRHSGDAPQLPKLVADAHAQGFKLEQVTADRAYPSNVNYKAVDAAGGVLYAPFRKGTTGGVGGLFQKAFHYFSLHREEFLAKYHRRSMIESTFSMVKRVLGDSVRSKGTEAMKREVLAKFVAHNIRCVIAAIHEQGINPDYVGLTASSADEPQDVLKFPGCTKMNGPAHL